MIDYKKTLASGIAAITLALATTACAQQSVPTPVADTMVSAETVEMAASGPAMWKLSDEDTTIYLFGTVHALPEGIDWYTGPVRTAFEASDTLVTEIPMGAEDEAAMQQLALTRGMLPAGTTLRALLDEDQRATYDGALTGMGLPVASFDAFEPWMAGLTMTLLPLMQAGYDPEQGVDKLLIGKAGDTKTFDALETAEFQIGIFDGMSQEKQIDFLVSMAGQTGEAVDMVDRMVAEWMDGDPDGLAEVMNEGLDEDPGLAEALLYNRNANWAVWIDERMDAPGTVFIAVGAGHLAGERSVQDLLAQRGLTVSRVE